MRIFVHDYSGHPFQAQLSRELAARGHEVTHCYCAAYTTGRGDLRGSERMSVVSIGDDVTITKTRFVRRFFTELRLGVQLARRVRRARPDVVMVSTAPVPTTVVLALVLAVLRVPWVLWHQDVQAVALRAFAEVSRSPVNRLAALVIERAERFTARRARRVVVITHGFLGVHRRWGTADRVVVIPNWAPVDEIVPRPRDNAWARARGLLDEPVLLYSGTLGLKHDPALLVRLAHRLRGAGRPVRLVVVNEGPAGEVLRQEAQRLGEPVTLLPFQPYADLPDVLGSGDVLVVLLEREAGEFSVPSKTLSYLCAGRPVLGLVPPENLAATLIDRAGGCVLVPDESSLDDAVGWVEAVLADPERAGAIGAASRALAEEEFGLGPISDRFEALLVEVAGQPVSRAAGPAAR